MVGVLCQPNRKGATMTTDHRRLDALTAQGILLDDADFLREIVERVLQEVLEAEMTEHVGAAPHERTDARRGHRNGHKPRTLRTRVGTLSLLVPQDREGSFSTKLFARYQRNEKALVLALMEMYLEGVPGYGFGGRAIRGMGHGKALPGYARARRAPPGRRAGSRGGGAHEPLEQRLSLEEITETSGLDL